MPKKSLYLALSAVFFAATAQAAEPSVEALVANRCATCVKSSPMTKQCILGYKAYFDQSVFQRLTVFGQAC